MEIKVIGHMAPDTDTVCSPIAYAWFLSEIQKQPATAYISGNLNNETSFVLKHFGVETPEVLKGFTADDNLVIMDTNNPEELLPGIDKARVLKIIDHHKLAGGLSTEEPLEIVMKPIACTATIVWHLIKAQTSDVPKHIAGLMLACILSDTLNFTSPTTTDVDKKAAEELAEACGESMDELADAMFAAKSDLTGMSAEDILTVDSKVVNMNGKKVRVSVLETTKPENALAMKDDLLSGMEAMKKDGMDYVFFFAVDILKTEATLLVNSDDEKSIAEKAFGESFDGDIMKLPGVVSRKKQIIPKLEPAVS